MQLKFTDMSFFKQKKVLQILQDILFVNRILLESFTRCNNKIIDWISFVPEMNLVPYNTSLLQLCCTCACISKRKLSTCVQLFKTGTSL